MNHRLNQIVLLFGIPIVVFMTCLVTMTLLLFFAHVTITMHLFWLSLGVTLIVMYIACKSILKENVISLYLVITCVSFLLFIAGMYISGKLYDLSFDGQAYQQDAIIFLQQGWNPIYHILDNVWIDHYPKTSWILSAALYTVTHQIECSKVFNLMLIVASCCFSLVAWLTYDASKVLRAVLLSLLLALNPISVVQSTSFYVDGQLASLLIIILSLGYLIWLKPDKWLIFTLCCCLILTINLKFTALVYVSFMAIAYLLLLLIYKKRKTLKTLFFPVLLSFVCSVFVLGFNPYVMNMWFKGHPFYPLAGNQAVNIVTANSPAGFSEHNRIEKFAMSLFSRSENNMAPQTYQLKVPHLIYPEELRAFLGPDVRIGGFGPLFAASLLLGMCVCLFSIERMRVRVAGLWIGMLILSGSALMNPELWWARYVPQLWFVPILAASIGLASHRKVAQFFSVCLLAVVIVNASVVTIAHFTFKIIGSQQVRQQLQQLAQSHKPVEVIFRNFQSNRVRWQEKHIQFQEVNALSCSQKQKMAFSDTQYCLDNP